MICRRLLAVACGVLFSCGHGCTPRAVSLPDGGATMYWPGESNAAYACRKLQQFGCPLGNDPGCVKAFSLPPQFGDDPMCVIKAPNKGSLAACNVTCE